jgi:hypothetical protein
MIRKSIEKEIEKNNNDRARNAQEPLSTSEAEKIRLEKYREFDTKENRMKFLDYVFGNF